MIFFQSPDFIFSSVTRGWKVFRLVSKVSKGVLSDTRYLLDYRNVIEIRFSFSADCHSEIVTPTPHGKRALRNSQKKVDDVSKILIVIYQNRMMTLCCCYARVMIFLSLSVAFWVVDSLMDYSLKKKLHLHEICSEFIFQPVVKIARVFFSTAAGKLEPYIHSKPILGTLKKHTHSDLIHL